MRKIGIFMLVVLVAMAMAGCAQKADNSAVSAYADDISEKMLLAYNDDNYTQYIANTDDQFKSVVSEDKMKQGNQTVRDKIGNYVPGSKQFTDAVPTTQNNQKYIAVRYSAKFTNETGDVVVTMVFDDNESHQVGGIFFNSPKLRQP
jgi:hypothetical protein